MSTISDPKDPNHSSVFSNMPSLLNPIQGLWPSSLILPEPSYQSKSSESRLEFQTILDKRRRSKEITACPHVLRKHYAKNMCNNCYHKKGRDKYAWKCHHSERKHYAKGFCQNCYLKDYNLAKAEVSKTDII